MALAAALSLIVIGGSNTPGVSADLYDECFKQCSGLTGQGRSRCIRTCIIGKRRHGSKSNKSIKQRFSECEEICKGYSGLENIKCLRICIEKNKGDAAIQQEQPKIHFDSCKERCNILNGAAKYTCQRKCEREKEPRYRDPTRFKRD